MATQLNNNNSDDGFQPMLPEFDMVPSGPQDGAPAESADSDLIMRTLFGGDTPEPATKSAGDQGNGAKPADGATKPPAPASPVPAANGDGVAPATPGTPSLQQGNGQNDTGVTPPQTPAPGTPPAAVEQAPVPSGLTAEDRLMLANARALAEQNQQLLEQLRNNQQPAQPQAAPTQPGQPTPQQDQVHLAVPNDLYAAVFNEDENVSKQGMNVLISAIATKAVQEAVARADTLINQRLNDYSQNLEARTTAVTQEEDFYNAYPALKNDLYLPVIQRESGAMLAAMPNAPWNQEFRDALGARVQRQLALLGIDVGMVPAGGATGAPAPTGFGAQPAVAPQAPQPSPPAPMLDTSSRAAAPTDAGNFIAATFL